MSFYSSTGASENSTRDYYTTAAEASSLIDWSPDPLARRQVLYETTIIRPTEEGFHRLSTNVVRRHSESNCSRSGRKEKDLIANPTEHFRAATDNNFNRLKFCGRQPIIEKETKSIRNEFARTETLILFDWDDTLLPSSWLASRKLSLETDCHPTLEEQTYLNAIAERVCSLTVAAVRLGRVVIVTNAEAGWVELSAAKFFPRVLETFSAWGINIVSARTAFQAARNRLPVQWKSKAFQHLLNLIYSKHNTEARCNVISFGDSNSERLALINCVTRQTAERPTQLCFYKTFKLCEHPTPMLLQRQLLLVERILPRIVHHTANLDLRVNLKESLASPTKYASKGALLKKNYTMSVPTTHTYY